MPYYNKNIFSKPLRDDDLEHDNNEKPRDWIIVLAPEELPGMFKPNNDPNPCNLTYLRISPKGKILEKLSFNSPSNGWKINAAYEHNGSVYLYGPAVTNDPSSKYYQEVAGQKEHKGHKSNKGLGFTNYQLAKITKGKLDFISSPSISDLQAKQVKPKDQKNFVEFTGEDFSTNGITVATTGDVFITCQNKEISRGKPTMYGGVSMFHFDPTGNLKRNYGVFNKENEESVGSTSSYIYPSGDGKSLYWLMRVPKVDFHLAHNEGEDATTEGNFYRTEDAMDYGSINIEKGELSEFKTVGEGNKKPFYLYDYGRSIRKMGNYIYLFSKQYKGDKILLTRLNLSK